MSALTHLLRARRLAAATALMMGALGVSLAAPATAAQGATASGPSPFVPDEDMPAFYTPPEEIPQEQGAIIRNEPMEYHADPLHITQLPGTATRMMYTSRDRQGESIAVTGTVIEPDAEWTGPGERPTIGYAVGTQGLADRCAPSYSGSYGWEYEVVGMSTLLKQGYALAITDYEGLGTPGPETYMNREVEGNAVIDSVRAARNVPGADIADDGPVAFVGYSQGGGSAGSAAELVGDYAPELDVKGTVAGAAPADLEALVDNIDGGIYSMFAGYTFFGLAAGYGIDTDPLLNETGRAYVDRLQDSCTIDLPQHSLRPFTKLTTDGRSLTEVFGDAPFADVVAEQRIGERTPSAPVLVYHSLGDEIVPYSVGRGLAEEWCAKGANVRFRPTLTPTHLGAYLSSQPTVSAFLEDAFAGKTQVSNCSRL